MRGKDLLRELQRTVDELAVLNEIGKALTSSLDIGEVMHVILAKVSELLKPSNWSLLLKDHATEELYFHGSSTPASASICSVSASGRPTTLVKLPSMRSTKAPASPWTA